MWGKPESPTPAPPPAPPAQVPEPVKPVISGDPVASVGGGSRIGQFLLFKAQISGDEDLYIDGEFEG